MKGDGWSVFPVLPNTVTAFGYNTFKGLILLCLRGIAPRASLVIGGYSGVKLMVAVDAFMSVISLTRVFG